MLAFANVLARVGCVGVTEKYLMEPLLLKSWSFQYGAMTRCVIGNVLETYAVYGLPKLTSPLVLTCMNKRNFEITVLHHHHALLICKLRMQLSMISFQI